MIYLHIPYCKQACAYCDFYFTTNPKTRPAFVDALVKEIELQSNFFSATAPVQTVYYGGGTPSLLTEQELERIFAALRQIFAIADDAEITLEANPDDLDAAKLKVFKNVGINRLSIGLQSFDDDELRQMNRAHTAAESFDSVKRAQDAGFDNLSLDLIFATPFLTDEKLERRLGKLLELDAPHLSCYSLTIEKGTKWHHETSKGRLPVVPDEDFTRQFLLISQTLEAAGYEHYEISNFAKTGFQSRHNSAYWRQKPYLGLGPSAAGFDGEIRYKNVPNVHQYIEKLAAGDKPIGETETLTLENKINEFLMTRLRLKEGFELAEFNDRFNVDLKRERLFLPEIVDFIEGGQLIFADGRLCLSPAGRLIADHITAELLF